MLTRKDKDFIINAIRKSLTVEVQKERYNKDEGKMEYKQEEVYLPEFWVEYLPKYTGALRGIQEDVDHMKTNVNLNTTKLQAVGGIFLQLESSLKSIAALSDSLKQLESGNKTILIEEKLTDASDNN